MVNILTASLVLLLITLALVLVILITRRYLVPDTPVTIAINGSHKVSGHFSDTLLHALSLNDIHLSSACAGAGTCGLCGVRVLENVPEPTAVDKATLSRSQLRNGYRLACQLNLRSTLTIELPEALMQTRAWDAKVISNRLLSPLIHELRLEVTDAPLVFEPGDFVQITAPVGKVETDHLLQVVCADSQASAHHLKGPAVHLHAPTTRAYSLANRPEDSTEIILMVRWALPPDELAGQVPPGAVSSYLCSRKPCDTVAVTGPHAGFHIEDDSRELVFVSGGVGLAPLRSMVYGQLARQRSQPMTLFFGARTQHDLLYREEFDAISNADNGFSWTAALSEPDLQWSGERGFIHEVLQQHFLNVHPQPANCDYYLCGPPLMVKAVKRALQEASVNAQHIYTDDFSS